MKSIIEREATFENNSDMEDKVAQKKLSRAFANEARHTQQSDPLDNPSTEGGVSPRSKCPCVRQVCPILNL